LRTDFGRHYPLISPALQPPFPGVVEVCEYARATGGDNYIVTHRERSSLQALLDIHGLAGYFSDCITHDDDFPRKPDPAGMNAMVERHNLPRDETLVIGDRDLDLLAGRGAGLRVCHFGRDLPGVEADLHISDFADLLRWLKDMEGV
jgi:phosphoglycolate phosphatase-like HAD superfamily hydrolase